jgi:8-oxo-dGTP pyrophosphatase MutT (NUDIX family)
MLDPGGAVCLIQLRAAPDAPSYWITPGGGLESDEDRRGDFLGALRRELAEELGLDVPAATLQRSPWVWERTHAFVWLGKPYLQYERYYLLRWTARPAVTIRCADAIERATTLACRWWTPAEVRAASSPQTLFAPRRLAALVERLCQGPPPHAPDDVSDPTPD